MRDKELFEKVRELMYRNISRGFSKLLNKEYCYVMPAPDNYPFQWFWDTCFHVFILCALGEYELAKRNMISLFAMQEENGFVGHMIFWKQTLPVHIFDITQARPTLGRLRPHMSALIQPSFVAQAILRIYSETNDIIFLNEMLPKLKKYHNWLIQNRAPDTDGLIVIITPYESGLDSKPSYDPVIGVKGKGDWLLGIKARWHDWRNFMYGYDLKRILKSEHFYVKDVLVNTVYALDLEAMSKICSLGGDTDGNTYYSDRAKFIGKSIFEQMYDKNDYAFYDTVGRKNQKLPVKTFSIFLPCMLEAIPPEISTAVFKKHLFNKEEFDLPYPIPSVAKHELSFDPLGSRWLWRGPTWVVGNWLMHRCLKQCGLIEKAEKLHQTIRALIEKSGFREYYNPFTGEGYGAHDFTWSGLIIDMINSDHLASKPN